LLAAAVDQLDPVAVRKVYDHQLIRYAVIGGRKIMAGMDGYVRVSRVAGRKGESYISPKVQRDKITGWAKLHEVPLGEVVVEEDVSGAKPVDERGLGRLLGRVESGQSVGIIAYKLSRFGRGALETLQAVERIKKAGGRLVTVEDGVDSAKPGGRLLLTVLAGLAEEELEQRRAGWASARRQALERGVHVGPTPIGYRRGRDGRLDEDERAAPFIAAAFSRRGQGESWGAIARYLEERKVLPLERKGRKSVAWSRTGVTALIRSRVYRGELWDGAELVCKNAHKAIVTESQWRFAQLAGKSGSHVKDGSIAAQGILSQIVYCAACGNRLSVTGSTSRNGERIASYFCRIHHATSGDCPAPAVASTRTLDPYVEGLLLAALADPNSKLVKAHEIGARIDQAAARVKATEEELDSFLAAQLASVLGPERYRAEVERRQDDLRAAQRDLSEALTANLALGQAGPRTPAQLLADWPTMTINEKRAVVRAYIDRVTLTKADPKRRRWQPIEERVQIDWAAAPASSRD
jgi:DNA invertase Pin-like site-specific DNA recombinase